MKKVVIVVMIILGVALLVLTPMALFKFNNQRNGMPERTGTPEAMIKNCIAQPTLLYCASVCNNRHLLKPQWCR